MLFILVILLLLLIYWYSTRNFNYWKLRGVKHDYPFPVVGNNFRQFVQKASIGMTWNELYQKYPDERVVGFYRSTEPELLIRDPGITKRILLTDFNCFYARGLTLHKTNVEPLLKNLFFADGDLWRLMRQRFTPAFSTAKLKAMFHLITKRAEKLQVIIEEIAKEEFYDARELMARYTTDFIGECGFGINMDAMTEDNNQFRKLGKRIFERNLRDVICVGLKFIFPELCKNLTVLSPELEENMTKIVKAVLNEREYKPSGRNDFIDLLLESKQRGNLIGESMVHTNPDGSAKTIEIELDDLLMTAQVFVFFGAGFETSSTASSYTLHQLAFNPDCQIKVQEEIDKVLKKHDNKITYDAIKEMTYLEMVFYEAMRIYPSVAFLVRTCAVPEYTFPALNLTINEGVKVIIPMASIQNDEKYFENPTKFDPERFRNGPKDYIKQFVFLPFGEGPRSCVGARLGQMQSMAGLAAVLHKYWVEPAACSKQVPDHDPAGTVSEGFAHGLPLKFRKREIK